jgi:hypothetical protein
MIEKALEWGQHIYDLLDGDIGEAYDNTTHGVIRQALAIKSVPELVIAAWVRETRKAKSMFKLDDTTTTDPVARTKSLLQGDPRSPNMFNACLDLPAERFCNSRLARGWGGCWTRVRCCASCYSPTTISWLRKVSLN